MAERAYRLAAARARGQGDEWDMATKVVAEWRRTEVAHACGKLGLRCCSQDDYGAVKAHFENLLGEPGRALKTLVHGDPDANKRRQVEWKIAQVCAAIGKPSTYALGICRQRYHGLHLFDATVHQLWGVYFVLDQYRKKHQAACTNQPKP